jgi:hypothetical protein
LPEINSRTAFHTLEETSRLNLSALTIHTSYRGHPQLNHSDHQNLLRYDLSSAIEAGGISASISHDGKTYAVCAVKPLTWDTQHFGIPMAKLSVAASPCCSPENLEELLKDTLFASRKQPSGLHVSCEIDIDDYPCLNVLLDLGAKILDIKREYLCTSIKAVRAPKLLSRVRNYEAVDKPMVMHLLKSSSFETRFSRDPMLNPEKVSEMYRIWIEKLLDGSASDRVALVMEKNGEIQACGAIAKTDLTMTGVGLQLMNGGVYISSRIGTGGYYPILYSLIANAEQLNLTSQTCVSLNNHPATKVLEKMNVGTSSIRYAMRLTI